MTRGLSIVCLLLLVCSLATNARAQQTHDDPIARGVALRRQGKNAEALLEFRRAYERAPSPRALAQIALAEQALGSFRVAERDLMAALDSPSDPWIAHNLSALQAALETVRDHLATLYIETDVPGAVVYVAGEAVGTSPLSAPVRVAVGAADVAAERPGEPLRSVHLELLARRDHHVTLTLARAERAEEPPKSVPPQPAPVPQPAAPATQAAPASSASATRTPAAQGAEAPHASRPLLRSAGTVALTLSGALLASAVAANLARHHYVKQYNDSAYCGPGYNCTRIANAAHRYQTLMTVGYASAGALLVTGAVLLIVGRRRGASGVGLEPYYLAHGAGLAYRTAF